MHNPKSSPWWRDSHEPASGRPGAVHSKRRVGICSLCAVSNRKIRLTPYVDNPCSLRPMNISLTDTVDRYARDCVATGLYNNASEMIRKASRLKIAIDRREAARPEALRSDIAAGQVKPYHPGLIDEVAREVGQWRFTSTVARISLTIKVLVSVCNIFQYVGARPRVDTRIGAGHKLRKTP